METSSLRIALRSLRLCAQLSEGVRAEAQRTASRPVELPNDVVPPQVLPLSRLFVNSSVGSLWHLSRVRAVFGCQKLAAKCLLLHGSGLTCRSDTGILRKNRQKRRDFSTS
jgi:hypothetical protein